MLAGSAAPPQPRTSSGRMRPKTSTGRTAEWGPGVRLWQKFVAVDLRLSGMLRIHVDPITGRFLGLAHRGFYLADLRHGPRTVLEKKIPGDPDDGGPLDLDTRLASKGKAKLTDSFVNASGTQSQRRRASQMALQAYRALLMLWFLGNTILSKMGVRRTIKNLSTRTHTCTHMLIHSE